MRRVVLADSQGMEIGTVQIPPRGELPEVLTAIVRGPYPTPQDLRNLEAQLVVGAVLHAGRDVGLSTRAIVFRLFNATKMPEYRADMQFKLGSGLLPIRCRCGRGAEVLVGQTRCPACHSEAPELFSVAAEVPV
jgi:hypothetical protein